MARKTSNAKKASGKKKPTSKTKAVKRGRGSGSKKSVKPKRAAEPKKAADPGGAVSSTAKLLDATALAKMVVSQLEGAVRAVAMTMLRSRDGSLQAKYEQLSLDGQLEILATVLEQAAEITEATDLTGLVRENEVQIRRSRSLVAIFKRLETEFKRLRREI